MDRRDQSPTDPRERDHVEWLDRCAAFALGALDRDEHEQFVRHRTEGCDRCEAELHRLRAGLVEIGTALTPVDPPPAIKEAVLSAIRNAPNEDVEAPEDRTASNPEELQPWRAWTGNRTDQSAGFFFRSGADGDWEPTGVDGIMVRPLFVDRENDRMTALFRMAPGSSYVPHIHASYEECFVLEGELQVGETLVMQAGDYQRAEPGSQHPVQSTESGCLLLVSSSLSDEPLGHEDDSE